MWDSPESLRAIANVLFATAFALMIAMAIIVGVHLPIFPVRELTVLGDVKHVSRQQIETVVQRELRGNFFTINLDESRQAFEKLPWVRKVNVRRQWPDRLEIALEEHQLFARWGNEGLVNTYGELFTAATEAELPMFTGPRDMTQQVTENFQTFQQELAGLNKKVVEVNVSARRAWRLRLEDGMTLELGRDQLHERVEKFVRVYSGSIGLMREPPRLVDLRYPNGFAVRLNKTPVAPGKNKT
jgi:cell division protein FtsQ